MKRIGRSFWNALWIFGLASVCAGGELRAQRIDPGVDVSPPQTEVSVQTLKAEASEWGDFRSRVFSFRFERTAPMDFDLPVFSRLKVAQPRKASTSASCLGPS